MTGLSVNIKYCILASHNQTFAHFLAASLPFSPHFCIGESSIRIVKVRARGNVGKFIFLSKYWGSAPHCGICWVYQHHSFDPYEIRAKLGNIHKLDHIQGLSNS